MKQKVFVLLFSSIYLFFSILSFGQDIRIPIRITELERYKDSQGYYDYNRDYPSGSLDNYAYIGKKANTTASQNTFRLICEYDVSDIADNATIESAILYWKGFSYSTASSSTIDIQIKTFPSSSSNSFADDQWLAIDNANLLQPEGVPNYNQTFLGEIQLNATFLNYIKNALTSDILYISFRGVDESNFGTNLNTHYCDFKTSSNDIVDDGIGIKIIYSVLPITINLTAQNDMDGYHGGNIGIGKNVSATSKTSPYTITDAISGDNINLLAYENQSYGGYSYIWNAPDESEAPLNKSEWKKEIGGSSDVISTNQSTTYTVASTDNGANLIGYLKKVCNLTFANSFPGLSLGGSTKLTALRLQRHQLDLTRLLTKTLFLPKHFTTHLMVLNISLTIGVMDTQLQVE